MDFITIVLLLFIALIIVLRISKKAKDKKNAEKAKAEEAERLKRAAEYREKNSWKVCGKCKYCKLGADDLGRKKVSCAHKDSFEYKEDVGIDEYKQCPCFEYDKGRYEILKQKLGIE